MATYKLYTDGCYYPEDKVAGYGGYIEDEHGNIIADFSEMITDPLLFNYHESLGMKRGMQLCLEHNIKNVECYTDDKNLSKFSNKTVKSVMHSFPHHPVLKDIVNMKTQFENITFTHIFREENKKADKYSRKAIIENRNVPEYLANRNARKIEKLKKSELNNTIKNVALAIVPDKKIDFSGNYKSKDQFALLKKNFTDFIVVNTSHGTDNITTYYAKKDLNTNIIEVELIDKKPCKDKKAKDLINALTKSLQIMSHLDEVVVCFYGALSINLEQMLKGKNVVPYKLKGLYGQYQKELNKFKKVTYHEDNAVIEATVKPVKKLNPDNAQVLLFNAIKELGNLDYFLGKNPDIENLIKIKDSKKDDIGEIQKAYFSEFLKINMQEVLKKTHLGPMKKELVQQTIIEIREKLTNQGVHFRI